MQNVISNSMLVVTHFENRILKNKSQLFRNHNHSPYLASPALSAFCMSF